TCRLRLVRARSARPETHRRGATPAGQRGAPPGGDRGRIEAAVHALRQRAGAVRNAIDDVELAAAAFAGLRRATSRGRTEPRLLDRTGGFCRWPPRRRIALRCGRLARPGRRVAA